MEVKALPPKSLDMFCSVFDFAKGQADITCPASTYPTACLRACERRGLLVWDTERVAGKTKRWCALTPLGAKVGCESMALMPDAIKAPRNRQWVKVQFDVNNEDYQAAYQIAGQLAKDGLLAPTMRDLLQIHEKADNGDYSLFYQLYGIPETHETRQFETMLQSFARIHASMQELADENRKLREQLQNTPHSTYTPDSGVSQPVVGIRAIGNVNNAPMPVFDDETDDDLIEVVASTIDRKEVGMNFLRSIGQLNKE